MRHGGARGTEQCRPADADARHIRSRGSQRSRREETRSRDTLWSPQKACQQAFAENLGNSPAWGADPRRRARTPSGAGARTPTVARARTPSRARTSGADPQRRQSADPQWNWSADPHRSQSADPLSGADLRARTPSAGRARTPSGTGARTPTVARARTPEETSCPACWRAPREKASRAACWRAPRPGRVARARLRDLRCHELTRQGTVGS